MLQRITRVETKVDNMDSKLDRAINANENAVAARESAASAHKRIDKIEDNQKWLWRTIGGTVLVAIVGFILAGGLKP
ncbi:hemolysin XhlA family protein [Paenibacillus gorillae]|uniref:hemolysin XhlA family protein n=1 Tax=Paenibacillus gorillae TaxID=1243662 RepID=UPI0005A615F9|nr:hemolysin XhlA family protein [Paenibacillus gorillae]